MFEIGQEVRRSVVLVEGASDRVAVETLAIRLGRDLGDEGVDVVELGGATNLGAAVAELLGGRRGLRLAGLYDEPEERFVVRGLERSGLGPITDRGRLEQLGFYACVTDLEDELIRALGEARVLQVIEAQGELASFRLLQRQPVQRSWTQLRQLRRFISVRSGRKALYARALVEALDLSAVPRPLEELLSRV